MLRLGEEHGTDLAQYRPLLFHGKELSFMSGTASASVASRSNSVVRTFLSLRTSTKQSQTPRRVELAAPAGEKNGAALHLDTMDSKAESNPHRVELAAPAGEENGAALHLDLCKRFVEKGAAPLRSLSGVFS